MNSRKTFVFDIDGTLCTNTDGEYSKATPFYERIAIVNKLYEEGNTIVLQTARGNTTGKDWYEFTYTQLLSWNLKFHSLITGSKPFGDIYIDDKGVSDDIFFSNYSADFTFSNFCSGLLHVTRSLHLDQSFHSALDSALQDCIYALSHTGKIIFCGNGGSMSDALHLSAEFTGRYSFNRKPMPSIVLGSNLASLSCIANDYTYTDIFSREYEALAKPNDLLICLSTSGHSQNIISLLDSVQRVGSKCLFLTSQRCSLSDTDLIRILKVPSDSTPYIQHMHMAIGHYLVSRIENHFYAH